MPSPPAFVPALPLGAAAALPRHRTRCTRARPVQRRAAAAPVSVLQEPQQQPDSVAQPPPQAAELAPFELESSALRAAIKAIAVGKNGEKPIPPAIIPRCAEELTLADRPDAPAHLLYLRASFLGSLYVKSSLTPAEHGLLVHAVAPARAAATAASVTAGTGTGDVDDAVANGGSGAASQTAAAASTAAAAGAASRADLSVSVTEVTATVAAPDDPLVPTAHRLLLGEMLTRAEARALGKKLYAPQSMRPMKALIAHVMRVRHESAEELSGLAEAVAGASRASRPGVMLGRPIALVAEPYDGTVTWDLLTPLVCRHLMERHGLLGVMGVGDSAGPKQGPNLWDVAKALGVARWGSPLRDDETREFGLVAHQADVARGLSEWAEMRRVIVKRPAIATVEKYADVTPDGSRLFIGSAFHPGYVDKMGAVAQAVGFGAYIIVGRGMEGSIGLGVGERQARLLVGWRVDQVDGATYHQEDIFFRRTADEDEELGPAPKKGGVRVADTARKIELYVAEGGSGDAMFDARVEATLGAIDHAMALLRQAAPHVLTQLQYPSY